MKGIGIQLDENFDLDILVRRDTAGKITSGLVVGDTTYQSQAIILIAQKGEIKENPLTGVGFGDACNVEDLGMWRREITKQIEADGQQIETLVLTEKKFVLDARYIN
jgi:hypothetical protein